MADSHQLPISVTSKWQAGCLGWFSELVAATYVTEFIFIDWLKFSVAIVTS